MDIMCRYIGVPDPKTGKVKPSTNPPPSESTSYFAFLNKLPYTNCGKLMFATLPNHIILMTCSIQDKKLYADTILFKHPFETTL